MTTLKLIPTHNPQREIAAAVINGADPTQWFETLDRWNIPAQTIQVYALPNSSNDLSISGLLIIFDEACPPSEMVQYPYGKIGRLYLPLYTNLYPEVLETELNDLLLYPVQVFHPTIGLIGFEKADLIDFGHFLKHPNPHTGQWEKPLLGPRTIPTLSSIKLTEPPFSAFIQGIENEIDKKSLKDIPDIKGAAKTNFQDQLNDLQRKMMEQLRSMSQKLSKKLPSNGPNAKRGPSGAIPGMIGGLINGMISWSNQMLEELQNKRQSEIKKLLNLFDTNLEEALKYAIPINSKYSNRGKFQGSDSWKLSKKLPNFDLGGLGGGRLTEFWNIGHHYFSLQERYRKAAAHQLSIQNYRKAAYIFAHLLGDYQSAANALEQGGFYREAATLYKDHLKNLAKAATCLERAGLFIEAIELYEQLNRLEKVGDLYRTIDQEEQAVMAYEKVIEKAMKKPDIIEATRLIQHKLKDLNRAQALLLVGWQSNNQALPCLKKYMDNLMTHEPEKLPEHLDYIFRKELKTGQRFYFLEVLRHINEHSDKPEWHDQNQVMAFQVIAELMESGHYRSLQMLKDFVNDDPLLPKDTNRFLSGHTVKFNPLPDAYTLVNKQQVFQSLKHIDGMKLVHKELLILSSHKGKLRLHQLNRDGDCENYTWTLYAPPSSSLRFYDFGLFGKEVLLSGKASLGKPANLPNDFLKMDRLKVYFPEVPFPDAIACAKGHQELTVRILHLPNGDLIINHFDTREQLVLTASVDLSNAPHLYPRIEPDKKYPFIHLPAYQKAGVYLWLVGDILCLIHQNGQVFSIQLPHEGKQMQLSPYLTSSYVVIQTDFGLLVFSDFDFPMDSSANKQSLENPYQSLHTSGHTLAAGKSVQDFAFIPGGMVVLAKNTIYHYKLDLETNGGIEKVIGQIKLPKVERPYFVSASPKSTEVAVLMESGVVHYYALDERI